MNQREVTSSDRLLWPSQKVLPKDDSGKRLLGESRHVEGFQCCSRPGMWDPPQPHQLELEVLRHELNQPLQVPHAPRAWAALSCLQEMHSGPAQPGWASNLSMWPLVRGGSLFPRQGPAVAMPPSPTQPSWLVPLLGEVAGGSREHRSTFTGHLRGPVNKCKDL